MSTPRYTMCLLLESMSAADSASTAGSTSPDYRDSCRRCAARRPPPRRPRESSRDRCKLVSRGAQQRQPHQSKRGTAAERAGNRVERARGEARAFRYRVYRLPDLGIEFRLERIESAEVVEAGAVQSHPLQQDAQPQGLRWRLDSRAARQWRQTQRHIAGARLRNRAHRGVDEQLSGAVRRVVTAYDLLDQPAVPRRNRRQHREGDGFASAIRNEDAPIREPAQRLRLDEEMERRQTPGRQPLVEN